MPVCVFIHLPHVASFILRALEENVPMQGALQEPCLSCS